MIFDRGVHALLAAAAEGPSEATVARAPEALQRHCATPRQIADRMEEWLVTNASDGFNVMFPYLPGGLDAFVDTVIPELQRRGLFRTEYTGPTLRDHIGLRRPANRFFPA